MENRHGPYQEKLLHTILNHELPEDASELVYKIVIRLLEGYCSHPIYFY